MAKNGLPRVFSCSRRARGAALSTEQWSVSATNSVTSSSDSGARTMSRTLIPVCRMAPSVRSSG